MSRKTIHPSVMAVALAAASVSCSASAADPSDLQQIRQEIDQLRQTYGSRIRELEQRLQRAESSAASAKASADASAQKLAQAPVASSESKAPASGPNALNPGVSLVLSGLYSNLSKDPEGYRIRNFIPGGEIGPGKRGFSLTESELGLSANIDHLFYGQANFSISSDNEIEAEEAFVQTTTLPKGFTLKAGRYLSGIGYLNDQHSHTWDFVDAPLAYQAFLGGQFKQDGVQMRWLAPSDTFLELGGELGNGGKFPGADRNKNGAGAAALFAHVGGDVGLSNSWRSGLSWLRTAPRARSYDTTDVTGSNVTNEFSGRSRLWLADFVWKWAPNGNAERTNLKLQGEYFRRRENGSLVYDTASTASTGSYLSSQSGWYLQGVYQFMPQWRTGLRYDRLASGNTDYGSNAGVLANTGFNPTRSSLMFDWTPSEFSRVRLQFARDKSRDEVADRQIFLQYQMSLGAHGAHQF